MDMRRTQDVSGAVGDTDTSMECGDWRSHLQADLRQRVINRIMETLKRHLPFSGHEGLQELKKIAVRFEEKIYTAATSQSDYLRKISLKMLTMETRSQNPMPDAMQANSGAISVNPSDPGSQVMQQVNSQGQPLPILVPSNQGQQLMQQTMHNNMGSTMHNNLSNNFSNQRQIPGRQQQQQQQQQTQNSHYVYQQQLQKIAQQKLQVQQGNIAPSMQQIQQQQQQNLLQQPSVMQPTMMQSVQNQQSVVPQSNQPLMNHQQQSALRQQQLNMMQQRIPNVGGFQQQNVIDQQKQLFQQQRPMQETSSTSLDFTLQTGNPNGGDWQEEVYQKIKVMKDLYLLDLNDMHQKILGKLQEHESLPQQPKNEQLEKLKVFKNMLERFMAFLQIPKHNIPTSYKDKLTTYEKQIVHIITSNRRKPAPTQQQPMPHKHSMQQSQHTHSSSPLLAEFSSPGGNHDVVASIGSRKSVEHVGLTDDHSFAPKFLFFLESFLVFLFIFYISVVLMSVLIV